MLISRKYKYILPVVVAVVALGCLCGVKGERAETIPPCTDAALHVSDDTPTEAKMREMGLVDVQELDSTILVGMIYATADNFMGEVLYTDIHKAFLLPQMAEKVVAAQHALRVEHPELGLLIWDAARPLSVQRKMFHKVAGTPKNIYVSNPKKGPGMHNLGAAVDITIVDSLGNPIPMGTAFDHFGIESHIDKEDQLLASGKITQQEYDNRHLLRRLLSDQGLIPLHSEWWHFNLMPTAEARRTLKTIE